MRFHESYESAESQSSPPVSSSKKAVRQDLLMSHCQQNNDDVIFGQQLETAKEMLISAAIPIWERL